MIFCKDIYMSNIKRTTEQFVKESQEIFGDLFDYSNVIYVNRRKKIKIICPIHGQFEQSPFLHLKSKTGCPKCGRELNDENRTKTTEIFIKNAESVHNGKYDYSIVEYKKAKERVKIICPIHGQFNQLANDHLNGSGCPVCNDSKGEKKIETFLYNAEIDFVRQKKFDDCKNKKVLPFDFFLPKYNMCIEFDGKQHFKASNGWGGEKKLSKTQENDEIKTSYCFENKIKLLRIAYYDFDKIDKKLSEEIENLV